MFDVDVGGVAYRESEHEEPGSEIVTAPVGGADRRAHRLLRPSLPGAVPDPRRARRPADRRAVRLHLDHRPRPLGGSAAGAGDREPGLRPRPEPESARRRRTSTPSATRRSSTPGATCSPPPPRASASSPPTSTSPRRRRSASRCPPSPTAGPRHTPGRSSRRCTPDGRGKGTADRQTPQHPRRGDHASSPARASTRPASRTSPTRPASPTASSTTTSTPRTRCSTSSSPSAGRCC